MGERESGRAKPQGLQIIQEEMTPRDRQQQENGAPGAGQKLFEMGRLFFAVHPSKLIAGTPKRLGGGQLLTKPILELFAAVVCF